MQITVNKLFFHFRMWNVCMWSFSCYVIAAEMLLDNKYTTYIKMAGKIQQTVNISSAFQKNKNTTHLKLLGARASWWRDEKTNRFLLFICWTWMYTGVGERVCVCVLHICFCCINSWICKYKWKTIECLQNSQIDITAYKTPNIKQHEAWVSSSIYILNWSTQTKYAKLNKPYRKLNCRSLCITIHKWFRVSVARLLLYLTAAFFHFSAFLLSTAEDKKKQPTFAHRSSAKKFAWPIDSKHMKPKKRWVLPLPPLNK